jgi:hypothetical protein
MHSKTHNDLPGPQMAIPSFQAQQFIDLHNPLYREAKWCHKDVVYKEYSNTNVEPMARGAGTTSAADKQGTGCIPNAQRPCI